MRGRFQDGFVSGENTTKNKMMMRIQQIKKKRRVDQNCTETMTIPIIVSRFKSCRLHDRSSCFHTTKAHKQ